jgi:hypothetical protein
VKTAYNKTIQHLRPKLRRANDAFSDASSPLVSKAHNVPKYLSNFLEKKVYVDSRDIRDCVVDFTTPELVLSDLELGLLNHLRNKLGSAPPRANDSLSFTVRQHASRFLEQHDMPTHHKNYDAVMQRAIRCYYIPTSSERTTYQVINSSIRNNLVDSMTGEGTNDQWKTQAAYRDSMSGRVGLKWDRYGGFNVLEHQTTKYHNSASIRARHDSTAEAGSAQAAPNKGSLPVQSEVNQKVLSKRSITLSSGDSSSSNSRRRHNHKRSQVTRRGGSRRDLKH